MSTVVGHRNGSGIGDNLASMEWVGGCCVLQASASCICECAAVILAVSVSLHSRLSSAIDNFVRGKK